MLRQVVLDTETTGINPAQGHRLIEIGCVEMIDRKITNNHFHTYINPQREIDAGAFKVHGISTEFLQDKPLFTDVLEDFIAYVDGAELIIHNAPFDVGFIDSEFKLANWPKKLKSHCNVLDTLVMAKKKHPGQRNSLDALCKRYEIDNSHRTLHGALLDAEILAFVYLAMTGGQAQLFVEEQIGYEKNIKASTPVFQSFNIQTPIIDLTPEERKNHEAFVKFLQEKSGKNLWDETKIAQEETVDAT